MNNTNNGYVLYNNNSGWVHIPTYDIENNIIQASDIANNGNSLSENTQFLDLQI